MRRAKWVLVGLLAVLLLVVAGFTAWAYTPLGPMPEAVAALRSDAQVEVETGSWLAFRPADAEPATGLIFYPGGRVDPRSYAPMAREIARQGYLVVIVPMPFNLAVFGSGRASNVVKAYPEIRHWALGGHSLGGAMAASYIRRHPDEMAGLVLLASYPADNDSLAGRDLEVVSIYGTEDGLATAAEVQASAALLPGHTQWIAIEGGNHAGFGWYGPQGGDGAGTISRAAQQAQVVSAVVGLLSRLDASAP